MDENLAKSEGKDCPPSMAKESQGQISKEMDKLTEMIEKTRNSFDKLADRLQPIVRVGGAEGETPCERESLVPLANSLRDKTESVEMLREKIELFIDTIQL